MREIPAHLYKDPASGCQDNSPHRIRTGFALRPLRQVSLSMSSVFAQGSFFPAPGTDDTASYLCFNARNSIPSLFISSIYKETGISWRVLRPARLPHMSYRINDIQFSKSSATVVVAILHRTCQPEKPIRDTMPAKTFNSYGLYENDKYKSVRMSESPVHLLIFQPEFRNNPYQTD